MSKPQVLFTCSSEFKDALEAYAQKHDMSAAELIRTSVAKEIDYDLSTEKTLDGRRKYNSPEERYEAQKERQRQQRQLATQLIAAYGREERLWNAAILKDSLESRGVSVDD